MELSAPPEHRVPGDLAMWCFILAELAVFGVFFLAYAWSRRQQPALFAAGQGELELGLPTLNTLLLLAGSAAMLAGGGFLGLKGYELVGKALQGITLSSNDFWMFYLSLTVFHFLHVVLGMVIVAAVWRLARNGRYTPESMNEVETAAAYWHMVDLVWLLLFALVYVAR